MAMITEDEILKVAREALSDDRDSYGPVEIYIATLGARALAAHLAAGAEPVAWVHPNGDMWRRSNRPDDIDFSKGGWTALYATPPAPAVKVRKLEWAEEGGLCAGPSYKAIGGHVGYRIYDHAREDLHRYEVVTLGINSAHPRLCYAGTFDEAKAAAQTDYEQRIRSALSEDAGAADLGARRGLEVDGFGTLPVLEPTPAPASDDLGARLGRMADIFSDAAAPDYEIATLRLSQSRIRSDAATIASLRAEVERQERECRETIEEKKRLHDALRAAEAERDALKAEVARKDAALDSCRAATEFFDRAMAAPMHERIATGQDPWNWVEAACRRAAALAPIPAKEG